MVTVDQEVSEWWDGHQNHLPRFQIGFLQEGNRLLASFHHRTEKLSSNSLNSNGTGMEQVVHTHRTSCRSGFAPCKGIQDSLGFWIPRRGFWIPDSNYRIPDLFQLNLDSGFQSLVGFRTPWAVFRVPRPRIPDSTCENFPDSGIWIPLHGASGWLRGSSYFMHILSSQWVLVLFSTYSLPLLSE